MTSAEIIRLLAAKHSSDVFVPECKDGPTHTARHLRMDAWVMPKSWVRPAVTAYEVKVSRADFLKDDKWPGYLPLCNAFYFVAPTGVMDPAELPPDAGLMLVSKTGSRIFTKKRAPVRDVTIPEEVFRYILMCRATIGDDRREAPSDRLAYWRQWLEQKTESRHLGHRVGVRVREMINETESENRNLRSEIEKLEKIRDIVAEIGIEDVGQWGTLREVERKVAARRDVVSERLRRIFARTQSQLAEVLSEIDEEFPR